MAQLSHHCVVALDHHLASLNLHFFMYKTGGLGQRIFWTIIVPPPQVPARWTVTGLGHPATHPQLVGLEVE